MKKVQIALFSLLALATAITVGCGDGSSLPIFKQMAFLSNRDSSIETNLFVMGVDGSNATALPSNNGEGAYSPSISADGKTVVFSSQGNVWVSNADGSVQTQLTSTGNSWNAKLSPDGKKILYLDWDSTNEVYNLWVMKADGTGAVNFTTALNSVSDNSGCYSGSFSADSKKLVFSCWTPTLTTVYTADADGSNQATVYSQAAYCDTPAFSPDQKKIYFISWGVPSSSGKKGFLPAKRLHKASGIHSNGESSTTYGLVSINADGSGLTTLSVSAYEAEVLNASLYYTKYNSDTETTQIFTSGLDGSNEVALTDGSSYDYIGTETD